MVDYEIVSAKHHNISKKDMAVYVMKYGDRFALDFGSVSTNNRRAFIDNLIKLGMITRYTDYDKIRKTYTQEDLSDFGDLSFLVKVNRTFFYTSPLDIYFGMDKIEVPADPNNAYPVRGRRKIDTYTPLYIGKHSNLFRTLFELCL